MQGWYNCVENLMGQRHDRDQFESQEWELKTAVSENNEITLSYLL